jgi:hypothetical protein
MFSETGIEPEQKFNKRKLTFEDGLMLGASFVLALVAFALYLDMFKQVKCFS